MTLNVNQASGSRPCEPLDFYFWHGGPREETRAELEARIRRELIGGGNG
jgi:hypothetical protein